MKTYYLKKSFYSALVFFGTLIALSIGYSAFISSYPANVGTGSGLSSIQWNKMVSGLQTLDTNLSNLSFSGANVGIGTASPGSKLEIITDGSNNPSGYGVRLTNSAGGGASWDLSTGVYAVNNGTFSIRNVSANSYPFVITTGGNVGIGTNSPQATLDINGTLKVGGSVTGNSVSDIKAYIQRVACESRRGVWVENTGCQEYAYFTATSGAWPGGACNTGYHICTFPDLFSGGFESLRRPGYNSATTYTWIGGNYSNEQDRFFTTWGNGTDLACAAGSHYMMNLLRNAAGNTAWGCYSDSYNNVTACCQDNQ